MAITLPIRIGTRGSPLALAQAEEVRDRLLAHLGCDLRDIEICVFKTTGDAIQYRPLSEIGGKGLFTKELETALQLNEIDIAVHSMKDVPTVLQDGHELGAILAREDVRDSFVSLKHASLDVLPKGAVFGTSSLRRKAQILSKRPDLKVVEFRGNVQTRLKKLEEGIAVATLLACAGLNRLGVPDLGTPIETAVLLPAIAQGAIGIEHMARREDLTEALIALNDPATRLRVEAERIFLRKLDGSCRTPIAGLAEISGSELRFRGEVISLDGRQKLTVERIAEPQDANSLALDAAEQLLADGCRDLY